MSQLLWTHVLGRATPPSEISAHWISKAQLMLTWLHVLLIVCKMPVSGIHAALRVAQKPNCTWGRCCQEFFFLYLENNTQESEKVLQNLRRLIVAAVNIRGRRCFSWCQGMRTWCLWAGNIGCRVGKTGTLTWSLIAVVYHTCCWSWSCPQALAFWQGGSHWENKLAKNRAGRVVVFSASGPKLFHHWPTAGFEPCKRI